MLSTLTRRRGFPHKRRWAKSYAGGEVLPVTFPSTPLSTRVYIALGADLTADWLSWDWLDITDRVRHDLGITVTLGRGDERGQVTPSRCTIKVDNNDGYLCRRNPLSPYFDLLTRNTPIWIQLDPGSGYVDQYHGYVNEWPNTWADASGTDAFVTIQCSGVMRRLAQAQELRSPIYRTIAGRTQSAIQPIAYWPMEDGSGSSQFASAIPGVPAVAPAGSVNYAGNSELPGSDPLPTFSTAASCTFQVPEYEITGAWMVQFAFNVPSDPLVDTVIARIDTGNEGAIARFDVVISPSPLPSALGVYGYDPFGTLVSQVFIFLDGSGPANPLPADFYGNPWSIRFCEKEDDFGNSIDFIHLSGVDGNYSSGTAGAPSARCTIRSVTLLAHAATSGISFGHVAVHADAALLPSGTVTADVAASAGSLSGWDGEQAHARIKRLCREEGLQVQALAGNSAAMGPQGSGTLLAELRACEAADQGLLYEWQFGIGYQALSERYDQPVRFELDFDAQHIAGVPQPADDDQRLVNKFTASRSGGSSATAEKQDGTLGTGPGGSGIFAGLATVNVETDNQLQPYAGWKVWLGTVDEDRWPQLGFHLHGSPDLIPGWLSTSLGHRVTVANPPNPMNPYTIDAVIEGSAYRWDEISWTAVLNTSPSSPYMVGTVGDSTTPGSWPQTGENTELATELASGSTSLLARVDEPLFSTDSSDLTSSPLSVVVGGEVMPVSAISSAVRDTFTRTVSSGDWGTSDSGHTYTHTDSAIVSVNGTQGIIALSTINSERHATTSLGVTGFQDLQVWNTLTVTPTGAAINWGLLLSYADSGNSYYWADVQVATTGALTLRLIKRESPVSLTQLTTVTAPITHSTTVPRVLRAQYDPATGVFRSRIWSSDADEPEDTWHLSWVDTSVTPGPRVGVIARLMTGNTNPTPVDFAFDNLALLNPQAFTVERTLSKTHPAGSQLAVHRPLIAAY